MAVFFGKFFRRFFQKATANPTRGALVASAEAKHPLSAFLFCQAFFFVPLVSKKKADKQL
jgi:hypothetical protein